MLQKNFSKGKIKWFISPSNASSSRPLTASGFKGQAHIDTNEPEKIIFGNEMCSICFDVMGLSELVELDCGHMYHGTCIIRWLNTKLTGNWGGMGSYHRECTMCREEIQRVRVMVEGKKKIINVMDPFTRLQGVYVTKDFKLIGQPPAVSPEEMEAERMQEEAEEWKIVMGAVLD